MRQVFDREFAELSEEKIAELQLRAKKQEKEVPKQVKRAQRQDVSKMGKKIQQAVSAELYITGWY